MKSFIKEKKLANLYALIGRKFSKLNKKNKTLLQEFIDEPDKHNIRVRLEGEEQIVNISLIAHDELLSNEQYATLLTEGIERYSKRNEG